MAVPRQAHIVDILDLASGTRVLTAKMPPGNALGFKGGQYLIIDSGIQLPNGKMAKRAYSLISSDQQQDQFQLAVKRLGPGPASNFLHSLQVGDQISFSGPWGKFYPSDADQKPGAAWICATDTAISCVMGLLRSQNSTRFGSTLVTWLVESDDYFLPPHFVQESLSLPTFRSHKIEPVGHPARVGTALKLLEQIPERKSDIFFLAGDGAVIYAMRDQLVKHGIAPEHIQLECYFNNPEKKSL